MSDKYRQILFRINLYYNIQFLLEMQIKRGILIRSKQGVPRRACWRRQIVSSWWGWVLRERAVFKTRSDLYILYLILEGETLGIQFEIKGWILDSWHVRKHEAVWFLFVLRQLVKSFPNGLGHLSKSPMSWNPPGVAQSSHWIFLSHSHTFFSRHKQHELDPCETYCPLPNFHFVFQGINVRYSLILRLTLLRKVMARWRLSLDEWPGSMCHFWTENPFGEACLKDYFPEPFWESCASTYTPTKIQAAHSDSKTKGGTPS